MDTTPEQARRHTIPAPRRRVLRAVFEWWWNLDRRRHIAQVSKRDRLDALDEEFVVAAMARQLEEIRRLPEVAG